MNSIVHLLNFTILTLDTWQLQELNSILVAAEQSAEILTLAYFGRSEEVETYIRAFDNRDLPKLLKTTDYGDFNFQQVAGLNRNVFFIAVGNLDGKALWYRMYKAFNDLQNYARGVFITTRPQKKDKRLDFMEHFQWCWRKGFTNALILVDNKKIHQTEFEIYNYNPFLTKKVLNMSQAKKLDLFPDKFRNLHKYEIRTAAEFDPPRVFDRKNCTAKKKDSILGYVASLFQAFLKQHNAGMKIVNLSNNRSFNILDIIERVNNDEIDFSINPFVPHKGVHISFPILMLQRCIVVPFPAELPKYRYFIMPFETYVWLGFLCLWCILSFSYICGWFFVQKSCNCNHLDVGQVFLQVWRLMIYLPVSSTCCNRHFKWFYAVWLSHVATLGFILTNLYMASLASYFSGLIFKPLISSLEEVVQHHLEIDTIDYEVAAILENGGLPKNFSDLLNPRSSSTLLNEMLSLKPNQCYSALQDRISFILSQQVHLLQPISHSVKECINTVPFGFIMPAHSQFEFPMNRFILRATSSGLIDKWFYESIQDGYCAGILQKRKPQLKISRPLTLEHFQFGWFVLGAGYAAGLFAFCIENLRRFPYKVKVFVVYY